MLEHMPPSSVIPLLASLLLLLLAGTSSAEYRPIVGKPHPAFQLPEIRSGELTALADFAGKKVLLIHFASW